MIDETRLRLHALVSGRVQGVGFRYFVRRAAQALSLDGWVRNLRDGRVELVAEGPRGALEDLLGTVQRGPRGSDVSAVSRDLGEASGEFSGFGVRGSV